MVLPFRCRSRTLRIPFRYSLKYRFVYPSGTLEVPFSYPSDMHIRSCNLEKYMYSSPQKKVSVSIRSVAILLKQNGRSVPLQRYRPFRSVPFNSVTRKERAMIRSCLDFRTRDVCEEGTVTAGNCTDALAYS